MQMVMYAMTCYVATASEKRENKRQRQIEEKKKVFLFIKSMDVFPKTGGV